MKGQTNAKLASKGIQGESVNITLLTNQESHSDLIGAVITVSYGGVDTEYVWEGREITVKIPAMMEYSVSVSNIEGYATPSVFSATSQLGYSRKLEMTYNTEFVRVTLSTDDSSSVNGQIVTINGEAFTYNGTAVTKKVPFGTEYSVSVNDKSGYITPASQTFTASQPARNVDVVYKVIPFGVSIYDIDGNLTLPELWDTSNNNKAVGVAIVADNCRFVVAKEDISTNTIRWGGYSTNISTLTNYTDAALAATDFDGVNNTSKIIAAIGNSNDGYRDGTAAGDCVAYTFPNGKIGYLGAAGEWTIARQNKDALNSALTLIGGTTMKESTYWTSTEYSSGYAWIQWFDSRSSLYYDFKRYSLCVRAFTPYIANPKIISFTLQRATYQCWEGTTWGQWCSSAFNPGKYSMTTDDRLGTNQGYFMNYYGFHIIEENGIYNDLIEPVI